MVIVTRKHLAEAAIRHKDAANEIAAWIAVVSQVRWKSFAEVRSTFPEADFVDGYVIFNIRHNRYRLITVIHYSRRLSGQMTQGHIYIRSFLMHAKYNDRKNWDKEYGR
ncbi:MAG TPA: type II toxin-antitoxin system HigB family toxin [Acidobacteriaceae bacterium]|jgi:mRNA interferase HigB|nr:type II toxin-antitoxin system HigB family toxin [Acidobacteriaceae bacterium]